MLCEVCRIGLGGIWAPEHNKKIGLLRDFPEILRLRFRDVEDDEFGEILSRSQLKGPELYVFGHHADYDSLLRSKQQGCVACNEFGEANDRDDVNVTLAGLGYYSVFCVELSHSQFEQPTMLVYTGEVMEEIFHELVLHDENDYLNSTLSSSTSDLKTWTLAKTWLDGCLGSHHLCRNQALAGFAPTRLLELITTGAEKTFRLVQRDEFDPEERYITLSHCWGSGPNGDRLQLLHSTLHDLRHGFPLDGLPKTFRHAFEIIERLRVRYIWIDRLCIIQDSVEDWRAESATMQTIYRNGFLNIAALGSKDDSGGCFFDRDPAQVGPTIINLSPAHDLPLHYRFAGEAQTWASDFKKERLITRAWVLQERMLSARTLYFGSRQVFWECCTTNCCETIPAGPLLTYISQGTAGIHATGSTSRRFAWKTLIDSTSVSLRQDHNLLQNYLLEWSAAVRAYCNCDLTYPNDKLIALSGLARDMGAILRGLNPKYDAYLAGMWRITMPDSLLWKVQGPTIRPPDYRAPSWSWASVDGPVNLPAGSSHLSCPLVEVLGVEMMSGDKGVMGDVKGGVISLRGPLCIAKGLRRKGLTHPLYNTRKISKLHSPNHGLPINARLATAEIRFDSSLDEYDEVFIMVFWSRPYPELSEIAAGGLALLPRNGSGTTYHRVGYAQIDVEVGDVENRGIEELNPVLDGCKVRSIEVI